MSYYGEALKKKQKENMARFRSLVNRFNKKGGIRVGDWIKHPDGKFDRVTYIHRDENNIPFQIQTGGNKYSQYHLGDGKYSVFGVYISYSGGLDSGYEVPKTRFKLLGYKRMGAVWIWDRGIAGQGRGVEFMMKFRVFEVQ
jgi:hypothetical protein